MSDGCSGFSPRHVRSLFAGHTKFKRRRTSLDRISKQFDRLFDCGAIRRLPSNSVLRGYDPDDASFWGYHIRMMQYIIDFELQLSEIRDQSEEYAVDAI